MNRVVYYHIAGMHHWREVVAEQLRVLAKSSFKGKVRVGLVAPKWDDGYVARCFAQYPQFEYDLAHHVEGLHQCEFPTLELLEADCRSGAVDEVLYFHTKGVSSPHIGHWHPIMWRWQMNADLLPRAGDADLLDGCDHCGSSWKSVEYPHWPHYEGNFWAATAEHIRKLPPLKHFRENGTEHGMGPWGSQRHMAEVWLGQAKGRAKSLDGPDRAYYLKESFLGQDRQDRLHRINS